MSAFTSFFFSFKKSPWCEKMERMKQHLFEKVKANGNIYLVGRMMPTHFDSSEGWRSPYKGMHLIFHCYWRVIQQALARKQLPVPVTVMTWWRLHEELCFTESSDNRDMPPACTTSFHSATMSPICDNIISSLISWLQIYFFVISTSKLLEK